MSVRSHNMNTMLRNGLDEVPLDTLKVISVCQRCVPGGTLADVDARLVSPNGVVHTSTYETTDCGHDATGPGWWWAL